MNVASNKQPRTFLGEKHFFQANEGKVIPFIIVITPLIVFVTESHETNFWLFSRRIHLNNLNNIQIPVCFAFSFHFLHLFFAELTEFFHKTPWKTLAAHLYPNTPHPPPPPTHPGNDITRSILERTRYQFGCPVHPTYYVN